MNVQKINKTNFYTPHPGGSGVPGGGGWGAKCQKCGKFHELPRKSIKKILPKKKHVTPTPTHPTGGFRGENFKVTKLQGLKSISGMQLS